MLPISTYRRIVATASTCALLVLLPISVFQILSVPVAVAQMNYGASPAKPPTLQGRVVHSNGKPAALVQVYAEPDGGARRTRVETDDTGHFAFGILEPGSYTVHAEDENTTSERHALVIARGSIHEIRLVVGAESNKAVSLPPRTAGSSMEFFDKPEFTVAGVTDWTAVGGHGSDATLRTSEELNRQALALRARTPEARTDSVAGTDEVETRLLRALSATPQSYTANHELGLLYLRSSRFAQAIPLLETALRIGGNQPDDDYSLAAACDGVGDLAAAQVHIKRALAAKENSAYHRLAGELEEKLRNPLAAVQHDEQATLLDASEENYFAWGTELLVHRAAWQAADVFANGAKVYPTSLRMRTARGAALFAGGRYEESAEEICKASDLDPTAREPYLFAGKIAIASPKPIGCVGQKLQRFLAQRPNDPDANYFYAMFLLKGSRDVSTTEKASGLLLRAITLEPKCSDGHLQLGILSAAKKDYAGAIAHYKNALQADPHMEEAHYRLAIAYDRTGASDKAGVEYRLHEEISRENAAAVEQQRRAVKQFSIEP